ncbi:LacI family DNA-binding transcriptional regulator [Sciscionella sediminilitoris]|uniref:LacI family DNA-binding transcriptional regulator n=1 Tax=Sciscionella sediminilitoris TaxID=1445613 RepID=UPI0004DF1CC3|nr:LacI family DNA-binding transcriptional regulator [Sciscionella sp. SE31]
MNDVARLAGVSIKTVSRVVNDEPGVHEQTARQVLAAIESLGFRRNMGARNLRQGVTTATVGLLLEDVSNPFYSGLTRGVEEVARQFGRRVLSASSDEDPVQARELALDFCARRVDGLLIVPAGREQGYLAAEIRAGTPVVFIDRPGGDVTADTVLMDNVGGTMMAVAHLAEHGHRHIGFLGDDPEIFTAAERLRGFREGCARAGIERGAEFAAMGPHDEHSIGTALRAMFDRSVTALIGGNNRITIGLLRVLAGMPERPALIGFDDFELADLLDPPVTVIAHDAKALGHAAAGRLFARIQGDDSPHRDLVLPARLVPRGSGEISP